MYASAPGTATQSDCSLSGTDIPARPAERASAHAGDIDSSCVSAGASTDSVPYLIDMAQRGEKEACLHLARCYRLGTGGLEKSAFNAMIFYYYAGIDPDELTGVPKDSLEPDDADYSDDFIAELLIFRAIAAGEPASAESILKKHGPTDAPWARTLSRLLPLRDSRDRLAAMRSIACDDTTADEFSFMASLMDQEAGFIPEEVFGERCLSKLPSWSGKAGRRELEAFINSRQQDNALLDKALEHFHNAYSAGCFNPQIAALLLNGEIVDPEKLSMFFTSHEIDNLRIFASRLDRGNM